MTFASNWMLPHLGCTPIPSLARNRTRCEGTFRPLVRRSSMALYNFASARSNNDRLVNPRPGSEYGIQNRYR